MKPEGILECDLSTTRTSNAVEGVLDGSRRVLSRREEVLNEARRDSRVRPGFDLNKEV